MNRQIIYKLATPCTKRDYDGICALSTNLDLADGHLQDLIALLRIVLRDENFITLLQAEGLTTIPRCVAKHLSRTSSMSFQKTDSARTNRYSKEALRRESDALREKIRKRERPLLDDLLDLTTCVAYVERFSGNLRVSRYLGKNHKITLSRIREAMARIQQSRTDLEEDSMTVWSVARAKKELDELVRQTQTSEPQLIKASCGPVVIVVSLRRWNAMLRRHPELEKFFWQRRIPQSGKTVQVDSSRKP